MLELRWIKRFNGDKELQYKITGSAAGWKNVPTVDEEALSRGFVIRCNDGNYLAKVNNGLGGRFITMENKSEYAMVYNTELDAKIVMEKNLMSLEDYEIQEV